MNAPSKLIERMETETGQRIDSNDGNNNAMAGLLGAMSRMIGQSSHDERDDLAAGILIRHKMSREGIREQQTKDKSATMLMMGFSPDDL